VRAVWQAAPMSVEAMAVVLNHSTAKGTAKLVLLGIANHEGDGGAYPTIETLARYASVSERNVQKALTQLVSRGDVVIEHQQGGDRDCPDGKRPNRYRLRVSCPPWCDHTTQHRDTRRLAGKQLALLAERVAGRVSHPTPHRAERGVASDTPRGVASDTQTTQPTNPPPTSTSEPQTAREAPCLTCGQSEYRCQRQQTRWHEDERHEYRPLAVLHAKG
jgi:hypothetical protein